MMLSLQNIFISGIVSFIGSISIFLLIRYILTAVDARLKLKKLDMILMTGVTFLCILFLNYKYGQGFAFAAYSYLTFYLCLTAYVDKKTSEVYCIFNYISLFIGGIFYLYHYLQSDIRGTMLILLLIAVVLLVLAKIFHIYGDGDGEIFLVTSIFILAENSSIETIFDIYMLYMTAIVIITLTHLNDIDWKKKRFKKSLPFAPSIFAATIIILMTSKS